MSCWPTTWKRVPELRERWARERALERVPVTLLDGREVSLSPGGQNPLLAAMVTEFCALFTPGGHVLYLGDAAGKWTVFEEEHLAQLGASVDKHGKMPDLVVFMPDAEWLVLLEAASSHGPVDQKRRDELEALFSPTEIDLVFVSCFPTREEMRRHLSVIAWETDAWCADSPTHLIYFDGERLLSPYE